MGRQVDDETVVLNRLRDSGNGSLISAFVVALDALYMRVQNFIISGDGVIEADRFARGPADFRILRTPGVCDNAPACRQHLSAGLQQGIALAAAKLYRSFAYGDAAARIHESKGSRQAGEGIDLGDDESVLRRLFDDGAIDVGRLHHFALRIESIADPFQDLDSRSEERRV